MRPIVNCVSRWLRVMGVSLPILIVLEGCASPTQAATLTPTIPPTQTLTPDPAEITCPTTSEGILEPQCEALVALYQATGGENWLRSDGWLSSQPICSWEGVTCENEQVVKIDLATNNLQGKLPPEIGQLLSLQELSLYMNGVNELPATLCRLPDLKLDSPELCSE